MRKMIKQYSAFATGKGLLGKRGQKLSIRVRLRLHRACLQPVDYELR